jgi:RNA polymerase sigma-70 factor (ECF subfamily)
LNATHQFTNGSACTEEANIQQAASDQTLVRAAQLGDTSALADLFTRHRKVVHRYAQRFTSKAEDAEDLAQETMFRAFVNIGKFRGDSRFSSWLFTITANTAFTSSRKERKINWIYLDEVLGDHSSSLAQTLPDRHMGPAEEFEVKEARGQLRRQAEKLPPKYRSILQACVLDEDTLEHAALDQGISLGAARTRLQRARMKLMNSIKRDNKPRTSGGRKEDLSLDVDLMEDE